MKGNKAATQGPLWKTLSQVSNVLARGGTENGPHRCTMAAVSLQHHIHQGSKWFTINFSPQRCSETSKTDQRRQECWQMKMPPGKVRVRCFPDSILADTWWGEFLRDFTCHTGRCSQTVEQIHSLAGSPRPLLRQQPQL